MKRISQYCNRSESTILMWIRTLRFPAAKISGSWESDTDLVDEWRKKQIINDIKRRKISSKNW